MRRQRRVWRQNKGVVVLASVLAALVMVGLPAEAAQRTASSAQQPDPERLVGRWVRPDGGYVLEIREVTKEGSLKVGYFNPRSINVTKAEWRRKNSTLTVFIELRDINYPGSTYTLHYDPGSDRLKGLYYQSVEKQTFAIEFARGK